MLCRFDFGVSDAFEEILLGIAERYGIQAFSSPCIEDAPGGEENYRFTGKTVVSLLVSTIEQNPAFIEAEVKRFLGEESAEYTFTRLEYSDNEDWMKQFRSCFTPIQVGKKIVVRPPWADPLPGEEKGVTVLIDPGMAFGTGTHETTRLCLKLMEKLDVTGETILDIGAGSGILSIYLLKRSAKAVTAVEIDGPAVENLRKNYQLNGEPAGLTVHCLDLRDFEPIGMVDGLVANITSPVLLDHFHRFWKWLKPGGWAVYSGVNSTNAPAVHQGLKEQGFEEIRKTREGEWFGFFARKKREK